MGPTSEQVNYRPIFDVAYRIGPVALATDDRLVGRGLMALTKYSTATRR